MKKTFSLITLLLLLVFLGGCQRNQTDDQNTLTPEQIEASEDDAGQNVGLANPASENCLALGGQLQIKERKTGQYGVCFFDDNRQCEEWALFRGDCPVGGRKITGYDNEAEIFCAITGGQVEGVGTETPLCQKADGTTCAVQANFDDECPIAE